MSIYKEKLVSYLNKGSNFYALMQVFLDGYDHLGRCGEERYLFYSSVYKNFKSHLYRENAYWKNNIYKRISDEKLQHYFTKKYFDSQLFSVIFAYANNLTDQQIQNIAKLNNYKKDFQILNGYLYEDIEHFVVINNTEVKAIKEGSNIKIPSINLSLKILDN